jgi:hypothetical protein
VVLGQLSRGHESIRGDDFDCPIIVVEYNGEQRLLDGNHRINRWVASGNAALHPVNIHTIEESAEFIELSEVRYT